MSELEALIEKVGKLTGPDREVDGAIALMEGRTFEKMKGDRCPYWRKPGTTSYYSRHELIAYTASLDAAVALVDRVLPDREWRLGAGSLGLFATASIWLSRTEAINTHGHTPALALLLATLKAVSRAKEESSRG